MTNSEHNTNFPDLFSLKDKVAIVTGALGLIGKYHCKALANAGATVVAGDIDKKATEEFAHELGHDSIGGLLDITDEVNVVNTRNHIMKKYGRIDILVNNAAINDMIENPQAALEESKFENCSAAMFEKSLRVNITGSVICSKVFGSEMVKAGKGSIVNIASTYGMVGPDQSIYKDENGNQMFYKSASYPVSKGAIINFTRFLAAYWGSKGVRVNTLSPGGVENSQDEYFIKNYSARTPLGKMAAPSDYMGALIFLASDASAYMTGSNLVVDGGWTCW